jgi:hypothetical protein
MSQAHFTLGFPLKSAEAGKALPGVLGPLMPALFAAEDEIGTVHYSRFTVLSANTLLFLADFDGDFATLMECFATQSGPTFDAIFQYVENPPPTPVAANAAAFTHWATKHLVHPLNVYTAYPNVTVKDIKALVSSANIDAVEKLLPFLVILPIKSKLAFVEIQLLLRAMSGGITKDLDTVGTPHFAQFMPLEGEQVGFFTVYDGSFDKYIADFTKNIGGTFDVIFKFTKDPPPSPCSKHLQEFIDFAAGASRVPIGFYQAYPGVSVQDIHALIADVKMP